MSINTEKNITKNVEELTCPIRYALDIVGGKWKFLLYVCQQLKIQLDIVA